MSFDKKTLAEALRKHEGTLRYGIFFPTESKYVGFAMRDTHTSEKKLKRLFTGICGADSFEVKADVEERLSNVDHSPSWLTVYTDINWSDAKSLIRAEKHFTVAKNEKEARS